MTEHIHNDFQFLDVLRKEPKRKALGKRKREFIEIYNIFEPERATEQADAVLIVETPIVNGNVLFTTIFLTG